MTLRPGPIATVVLLAGLGTWVYLSEFRGAAEKQKSEQNKDRVFAFERSDLRAVVVKNPGGSIRLQKDGEAWTIADPAIGPADRDAVEGMLASLETARVERRLGTDGDRKGYGLDPAPMSLTIETAAGAPQTVSVGDTNPIGGTYYATLGSGEIALVGVSVGEVAKKDLFSLRDKALITFDPWKTKRLLIERGAETIDLEKKESGWSIVRPVAAPADGPTVTDLLSALERLRAASFVADKASAADLKTWGFEPPAVRMSVLQEGWDAAKAVEFGNEKDGKRNARAVGRDPVVAVGADFWPKATTALFDLRRHEALGLSQYRLRAITISRDGGPALVLEKGKEGSWNVSGLAKGSVPYDPVDVLVRSIADVKATAFEDRPSPALIDALTKRATLDATFEQEPDSEGGAAPRQHLLFGAPGKDGRMPVKDQDWNTVLWADGAGLKLIKDKLDALVTQATAPPPAPPVGETSPTPGAAPGAAGAAQPPPAGPPGGADR